MQSRFSKQEIDKIAALTSRRIDLFIEGSDVDQGITDIATCSGKHVLINVPCKMLNENLRNYVQHKRQDPRGTSACVVVPQFMLRRRDTAHLLAGMQLITSFEQDAFEPHTQSVAYRPVVVFYDPVVVFYDPVGLQLNALEGSGLTFLISGVALEGQVG